MDEVWEKRLGLTEEQAEEQRRNGKSNRRAESATKSRKYIICKNVITYFNLIFLIITILLIVAGSYRDLTFLPIILANTLIGIIQELRSKKVLDELSLLHEPHTCVIRNGVEREVSAEELVEQDVIVLTAGNQIPADALVLDGTVFVNEALLTGETKEQERGCGDSLLSGSYVVSGACHAKLEHVGKDAYISKLTVMATEGKKGEQSEMIRSLNRLLRFVGILILPVGALLFAQQYFGEGAGLKESVTGMVAAILGMIPEGLYLLTSVTMAVSTMRLAKQQVLLHDMKCIEALARVDVLCLDKTGTITEPEMEVVGIEVADGEDEEQVAALLADFGANMTADNATIRAIQNRFQEGEGRMAAQTIPFSPEKKYSGVQFQENVYLLGAPERLLASCEMRVQCEKYQKQGYRVLVFTEREKDGGKMLPKALILLTNVIRKNAKKTFTFFKEYGVGLKVISGDHPATVSKVAELAGIEGAKQCVDATELRNEEQIAEAAGKYTVFGRVTPEQKKQLVQALQKQGRTVAMTGDGVNDVLALKEADCGIAMASGSEAATQVAQLVLLDSDFSHMPSVVMEGRQVVNNIEKTASLYLVKNIFSILLSVFFVLFHVDYPLEPSQISLISMFTIGIPSFFFALEKNEKRITGHFLKKVCLRALPAALADFLLVSGLVYFAGEFGVERSCISTACTILIAVVGFWMLTQVARPFRIWHGILIGCMVAGWAFCALAISPLFAMQPISKKCVLLILLLIMATEPVLYYLKKLVEKISSL